MANKLSKLGLHMKRLTITSTILLFALFCKAQMRESDRIYWAALEQYTLEIDTYYSKYSDRFKDKSIYLQKPEDVDSIPKEVNGYHITIITSNNQQKIYKDHNNKLLHTMMSPVTVEDSLIYITFTPYHGELKKHNHYSLSVSDGTIVYFKFDCDKQRYLVYKVDNWGI
jgi:hypothetical protein